jgi:hypothetical protein
LIPKSRQLHHRKAGKARAKHQQNGEAAIEPATNSKIEN